MQCKIFVYHQHTTNKWQTEKNLRPDALLVSGYDENCFANLLNAIRSSKRNARATCSDNNINHERKYSAPPPKHKRNENGTSIQEVKIILMQAHSAMTRLAPSGFLQRLNSKVFCLVNVNTAQWMWEQDSDGGPGEANQASESKCYRRMLDVSYREFKTNEHVWQQVDILARRLEVFTVNRRALQAVTVLPCLSSWYVAEYHTTRNRYGSRYRGRPRESWKGNIKEWTGQSMSSLMRIADDRDRWAVIVADASVWSTPNDALL